MTLILTMHSWHASTHGIFACMHACMHALRSLWPRVLWMMRIGGQGVLPAFESCIRGIARHGLSAASVKQHRLKSFLRPWILKEYMASAQELLQRLQEIMVEAAQIIAELQRQQGEATAVAPPVFPTATPDEPVGSSAARDSGAHGAPAASASEFAGCPELCGMCRRYYCTRASEVHSHHRCDLCHAQRQKARGWH